MDVDKGVVLHGLGKVNGIQDFNAVARLLEHPAGFQNQSAFRICHHKRSRIVRGRKALHQVGFHEKSRFP